MDTPSESTAGPVTVRVELPLTVPPLWVKPATVIAEVPVLAEPLFIMAVSVEARGLPSDIAAHRSNCRYRQARYQSTSRLSGEALLTTNPGPNWPMIGLGDYNGAEQNDILLQKDNGQAAIWLLSGFSLP